MKNLIKLITALILLTSMGSALAVGLSLTPSSQTAGTGDMVSIDLVIDGLGDLSADSLGDFDLDIIFDDSKLDFTGGTLGTELGFTAFDILFQSGVGTLSTAQLSLEFSGDLVLSQPGLFVLATFDFLVDSLPLGDSTTVDFGTIFSLGNQFGDPLTIDSTSSAVIRNPNPNSVPEPATWLLLSSGMLFAMRKRIKR